MAIVPRGGLVGGAFDVSQVPDPNVRATLFDFRWALAWHPTKTRAATANFLFLPDDGVGLHHAARRLCRGVARPERRGAHLDSISSPPTRT